MSTRVHRVDLRKSVSVAIFIHGLVYGVFKDSASHHTRHYTRCQEKCIIAFAIRIAVIITPFVGNDWLAILSQHGLGVTVEDDAICSTY